MKSVLVILSVIFALHQGGQAELTEVAQKISTALNECITKNNLDKQEVLVKLNDNVIPEDNVEFTNFFACFSQALGTVNEGGDVDSEQLKLVLQEMLKRKMGSIPDVEAKALHIATEAIEHCKDTPKGDNAGLSAIKMRNCIKAYVGKTQPH